MTHNWMCPKRILVDKLERQILPFLQLPFFGIVTLTGWWFGCHFLFSQKYWISNHPNWRNHIFQRVGIQPPTRLICAISRHVTKTSPKKSPRTMGLTPLEWWCFNWWGGIIPQLAANWESRRVFGEWMIHPDISHSGFSGIYTDVYRWKPLKSQWLGFSQKKHGTRHATAWRIPSQRVVTCRVLLGLNEPKFRH